VKWQLKMVINELREDEMTANEMTVDEMTVDEIAVDEMTCRRPIGLRDVNAFHGSTS
jgi:hypothetical protein